MDPFAQAGQRMMGKRPPPVPKMGAAQMGAGGPMSPEALAQTTGNAPPQMPGQSNFAPGTDDGAMEDTMPDNLPIGAGGGGGYDEMMMGQPNPMAPQPGSYQEAAMRGLRQAAAGMR